MFAEFVYEYTDHLDRVWNIPYDLELGSLGQTTGAPDAWVKPDPPCVIAELPKLLEGDRESIEEEIQDSLTRSSQ